tara:strand:- start:1094 stop:1564 length:471 start_codon:yes stop_codon:yes gene_type:complete
MEDYNKSKEEARKYLKLADHILYNTYPLLSDPKLLLKVMDNIFLSITNTISALLFYEKLNKRITEFDNTFETKIDLFRKKCLVHHNFDPNYIKLILDVKEIIVQHRKSPVEFVKKNKFVICSNDYKMKTITDNDVKNYLKKAKAFYGRIDNILLRG